MGNVRTDGGALADTGQSAAIAFLADAASHPGAERVDVIETHGNLVFLAGPFAWKIKRAVRFAYMDFSTLELRHQACLHELEVNERLAPELYLGAVPVTRDDRGRIAFAGAGETIEWAVKMHRFDQADLLAARAADAGISADLAKAVADQVAASHAGAPRAAGGGASRVERVLTPLFASLAACGDLDNISVADVAAAAAHKFHAGAKILDRRAAAGLVRRCHGDLHCANIVIWRGKPMLYDAIEFDDELATVDTLYDLAFLLMDLERRGQQRAANLVLNRYLWRRHDDLDFAGLQCMPLFLAMRASVRALVTAERAEQKPQHQASQDRMAAADFLRLARGYLEPTVPRLVAVGGLSGTGKSTLAAELAPALGVGPGALHLRSDLERKAIFDVDETQRLPAPAYAIQASRDVYETLERKAGLALAAGWSVIVDAVSAKPEERRSFPDLARAHGASFQGLWLTGPPEVLLARVTARRDDASDADDAVLREQITWDTGPLQDGWQALDASGTMQATLQGARRMLGLPRHHNRSMGQMP